MDCWLKSKTELSEGSIVMRNSNRGCREFAIPLSGYFRGIEEYFIKVQKDARIFYSDRAACCRSY
jgi:hypothetical protein